MGKRSKVSRVVFRRRTTLISKGTVRLSLVGVNRTRGLEMVVGQLCGEEVDLF